VKGAGKQFTLDSSQLKVSSVSVNGRKARFAHDEKRSKLRVSGVPGRKSKVEIDYTKQVSDDVIFGLYKSKYGKDFILATDFEPSEARTVFPCVDEPACKAVFRLVITTESGLDVIANTPVSKKEAVPDGRTRFAFEPTPKMSTYLVFFAIGNFEETRMQADGVEAISATRPGQSGNSVLALSFAAKALEEYQRYYGIPYPLKKLHVVALPEYHTGAMENWGAISSREGYALITEATSFSQKNRGAMSMVHEVAHQWFGDLVTMKWWDDIWLNESFASFMSYKMTDRIKPDWGMWGVFLRDELFAGLSQDALSTTHAIQTKTKTVEEAIHLFDAISYNKGGSVLRMLEAYVGEDAFRRGVSAYLKEFSYSNATGKDLWQALGKASRLPVSRVAREWLTRPGYPVVTVRTTDGAIELSQRPFRLRGGRAAGVWPIPIVLRLDGRERSIFLDRKSARIRASVRSEILLDPGRTGFYTTLYDEQGYERLAKSFPRLGTNDRSGVLNDLYLFLEAGMVPPELYARFVSLCARTPDPITTQIVTEQLMTLNSIAAECPLIGGMNQGFYPPLIQSFGEDPAPGEPEFVGATRDYLTSGFAEADEGYARKMANRFGHFATLDSNIKAAAAIGYAVTNGASAKATMQEMLKSTESEVDRAKLWQGLCSFREPGLVEETLELGISGEVSRSDSGYPLIYASFNPLARDALWKWITKRYDTMKDIYAGSQQFYLYMGYAVPIAGVEHEREARRFFAGRRSKEGGSSVKRIMELLSIYARLRRRLLGAGN